MDEIIAPVVEETVAPIDPEAEGVVSEDQGPAPVDPVGEPEPMPAEVAEAAPEAPAEAPAEVVAAPVPQYTREGVLLNPECFHVTPDGLLFPKAD